MSDVPHCGPDPVLDWYLGLTDWLGGSLFFLHLLLLLLQTLESVFFGRNRTSNDIQPIQPVRRTGVGLVEMEKKKRQL